VAVDVSRPVALAAAAASLLMLVRFCVTLARLGDLGAQNYTTWTTWPNVLTFAATMIQGVAACVLLAGAIGWLTARSWAKPVMLVGLGGWLLTLAAYLLHYGVILSTISASMGASAPLFIASNVADHLVRFVLPLLLGWLVIRLPVRRST
jgi:hypothetical protein